MRLCVDGLIICVYTRISEYVCAYLQYLYCSLKKNQCVCPCMCVYHCYCVKTIVKKILRGNGESVSLAVERQSPFFFVHAQTTRWIVLSIVYI